MTQSDENHRALHQTLLAIRELNNIVKDHLTDGSGQTQVSFRSVDASLKAAEETLYSIKSGILEKELLKEPDFKVMKDTAIERSVAISSMLDGLEPTDKYTKVPTQEDLDNLSAFITRKVKEFDAGKGVLSVWISWNINWWFSELEKGKYRR